LKKEYEYGSNGELLGAKITRYRTNSQEVEQIIFSNHDSHGNWQTYQSNRTYKRKITYSVLSG
jgi:hypothetical protein